MRSPCRDCHRTADRSRCSEDYQALERCQAFLLATSEHERQAMSFGAARLLETIFGSRCSAALATGSLRGKDTESPERPRERR